MPFSTANAKIQRKLSIQNVSKVTRGGFQTFAPAAPGSTDGSDGAILIDTAVSGSYYTLKLGATPGSAASYQRGIARYSGVVTIVHGNTSGTLTVPAGINPATDLILYGVSSDATTAVVTSAPLITVSGTTLTVTVIDPGGATTLYVSIVIP